MVNDEADASMTWRANHEVIAPSASIETRFYASSHSFGALYRSSIDASVTKCVSSLLTPKLGALLGR